MDSELQYASGRPVAHELSRLKREWWVFMLLGILLMIAGVASCVYPFFTTLGVMVFLGITLMISGVSLIISAFWTGRWSGFFLQVLAGLFYFLAGFIIADYPVASAAVFTLMIAGFLIVTGVFRVMLALTERFPQWGWVLASGIVSLLLGLVIFKSFRSFESAGPGNILWIIGLMVGIELVSYGLTWLLLGLGVRRLPDLAPPANASEAAPRTGE